MAKFPSRTTQSTLGEALASGAEQFAARALRGFSPQAQIERMVSRKFGTLSSGDFGRLMELARRVEQAGRNVQFGRQLSGDDIPVNPALFGAEPGGRRVRVIGDLGLEPDEPLISVIVDFADLPSPDELYRELLSRAFEIINMYPEKFDIDPDMIDSLNVLDIVTIERRF